MMTQQRKDFLAGAIAALGWFGLGLQGTITVPKVHESTVSWSYGVIVYVSFFTILTNLLVAVILTIPLLLPTSRLGRWSTSARVRGGAVTCIIMVGLVYEIVLRRLWDPQGAQWVADVVLHDAVPILYLCYWVCCVGKGALQWYDAVWWLIYPLLYLGYTLWRGRVAHWYPYPFINVIHLGYGRVLLNAAGLVVLFLCLSAVTIAADRMLSKPVPRRG